MKNKGILSVGNDRIHEAIYDTLVENGFCGLRPNSKENILKSLRLGEGRGFLLCQDGTIQIMLYPDHWDIISIEEALKLRFIKPIEVKLNEEYVAVVTQDNIVVNGIEISFDKLDELVAVVNKVR